MYYLGSQYEVTFQCRSRSGGRLVWTVTYLNKSTETIFDGYSIVGQFSNRGRVGPVPYDDYDSAVNESYQLTLFSLGSSDVGLYRCMDPSTGNTASALLTVINNDRKLTSCFL